MLTWRCFQEEEERQRERQYQLLVNLERQDLVPSVEHFECPVCLNEYRPGDGVVLRECLHTFCRYFYMTQCFLLRPSFFHFFMVLPQDVPHADCPVL